MASVSGKTLSLILILVMLVAGAYTVNRTKGPVTVPERTMFLRELDVTITLPDDLTDLTYRAEDNTTFGKILSMQTSAIPDPLKGAGCELGVMYVVPKVNIHGGWTEAMLKARETPQNGVLPQVKELSDKYFIFEPSQGVCTNDATLQAKEANEREALWRTVPSAR